MHSRRCTSDILSVQCLIHFIRFMTHSSHPPIYELLVLVLQFLCVLFGHVELKIQRDHLVLDTLDLLSNHFSQQIKTVLTSINLAFPLSSSSRSLTFWVRTARSLVRSSIVLVSDFVLARSITNSASAAFIRACSVPFDRKASARSLLSCAFPSFGEGCEGSFGEGSEESLAAFCASRAAVRSRSVVSAPI